ncbi:hypothetical protein M0811_01187 [Anaeramoeba ignava]|uniref:Uncharacterized protein n=1 Tax=Anaeramoeba ignava TaxID=1746090 RepID=A0A9Q0LJH4_ANAIG|nr:hypothetical protein M0811_01187 [Anaeramoeba ignava]
MLLINKWIHSIFVIKFDTNVGQTIETFLPEDFKLSKTEFDDLRFLSLPDSFSAIYSDHVYSFILDFNNNLTKKKIANQHSLKKPKQNQNEKQNQNQNENQNENKNQNENQKSK